ncbi:TetR/AcrR family transcriptional regulator [Subtercola endophyticus]|uniref:TetR/AcrR family transcriptional regulator n=1 Tax=Subtercola endophyticus TaxID=2895559 RepID=UPI001E5C8EB5|nr:TetR family transcriptional regulator [Subtercola endophyticus]UFS58195.1 TetR family transcriptional regulator [Subtercola endophyticus]
MDARQRRSREKLRVALFELASGQPASELTVSQLAALAGVNRSTFYEHASSPQALLEELLRAELDAARQQYLTDIAPGNEGRAISAVTRAVLLHIDEHAAIYRFGLSEQSGESSLHALLSAHFEASIRMLVETGAVSIHDSAAGPSGAATGAVGASGSPPNTAAASPAGAAGAKATATADTPANPSLAEYAARYISSGTVGVITVWLNGPEPRDVDAVLHAYGQLLPGWWPAS